MDLTKSATEIKAHLDQKITEAIEAVSLGICPAQDFFLMYSPNKAPRKNHSSKMSQRLARVTEECARGAAPALLLLREKYDAFKSKVRIRDEFYLQSLRNEIHLTAALNRHKVGNEISWNRVKTDESLARIFRKFDEQFSYDLDAELLLAMAIDSRSEGTLHADEFLKLFSPLNLKENACSTAARLTKINSCLNSHECLVANNPAINLNC